MSAVTSNDFAPLAVLIVDDEAPARDRLRDQNMLLESEIARRMGENLLIQELSVRALACLSEARDNETGLHIVRTQTYVELLAQHLQGNEAFRPALDNGRLQMVVKAAPLHDIGKVGVPDRILLKPGELTPAEFEIMKRHTTLGRDAISKAETLFGVSSSFLRFAKEIAYSPYISEVNGDNREAYRKLIVQLCRKISSQLSIVNPKGGQMPPLSSTVN